MTTEEQMAAEEKRAELREKIYEGEAHLEERTFTERAAQAATDARDSFTAFANEHPVATVLGGLALGVIISGFFKQSPTRKLGNKAAGLAAVGAELALAYAQEAYETASEAAVDLSRAGADRLEDMGDAVNDSARSLRREARYLAGSAADHARASSRDVSKAAGRAWRNRAN